MNASPSDARRELTRLLPDLRDRLSAGAARLQEHGEREGAGARLREELGRLHGAFLFVGVPELERVAEELRAAAAAFDPETDGASAEADLQPLRAALMDALLRLPRLIERMAVRGDDPVTELAELIDGLRRSRGQPRYNSLALLRRCVDPRAPRKASDASERVRADRWSFQRALLELIRGDERLALEQLHEVLEPLGAELGDSAAGAVCWGAAAVVDGLAAGTALEADHKRAVAAYDRELRRLIRETASGGVPAVPVVEALLQPLTREPAPGRPGRVQAAARRMPEARLAMPGPEVPGSSSTLPVRSDVDLSALFYAEVGPALAQIGAALQRWRAGDPEAGLAVQRILHTLKGGARFAGLQGFVTQCNDLEHEVATALADGPGPETESRLRRGLEELSKQLGTLRKEVQPAGSDSATATGGATDGPGPGGDDLRSGSGAEILGEALASELAGDEGAAVESWQAADWAREPDYAHAFEDEDRPADQEAVAGADSPTATLDGSLEELDRHLHAVAGEFGRRVELVAEGMATPVPAAAQAPLAEALRELLTNAVLHGIEPPEQRMQQGKPEVGRVAVAVEAGCDQVRVSVSDDGRGLDTPALQAQVSDYDPEEPAAELSADEALSLICLPGVTTFADPPRVGAGMERVAAIVHDLAGTIDLQASPGAGARFTLSLPMPGARTAVDPSVPNRRVLVLDDSRTMRRITAHLLARSGFDPEAAESLEVAEAASQREGFQAVVVNLEMFAREAVAEDLLRLVGALGLPGGGVVALSTRAVDQDLLRSAGLEAACLLLKPYDERQLTEAVGQACACGALDFAES